MPTTWLNLFASSKVIRPTEQPMSRAILGTPPVKKIRDHSVITDHARDHTRDHSL